MIAMTAIIAPSHDARSIARDDATITAIWRDGKTVATRNFTESIFLQWTTARDYAKIQVLKQKSPRRWKRRGGLVPG